MHYVYEKRVALCLRRSLTEAHFEGWVEDIVAPFSAEALIARIEKLHAKYKALPHHSIVSDMEFICQVTTLCVKGIINISYVCGEEKTVITA